jgi:hypothetical protein
MRIIGANLSHAVAIILDLALKRIAIWACLYYNCYTVLVLLFLPAVSSAQRRDPRFLNLASSIPLS